MKEENFTYNPEEELQDCLSEILKAVKEGDVTISRSEISSNGASVEKHFEVDCFTEESGFSVEIETFMLVE